MKNKTYHIVGTILKSNRIITETGNIILLTYIYIYIYNISFMVTKLLLGEWWGYTSVFYKWVKCHPRIISLKVEGGRAVCYFRKLHYQLCYNLSFSYLYIMLFILLFWCFFFIFRLLFITGSSSPSLHRGFNQRQGSGIIFYIIWEY